MKKLKLRDVCHARSGDKGDTVNIGVACYDLRDYEWLARRLTTEAVIEHFGRWVKGPAARYELPNIGALNFVIHGALDGGVTCALMIDGHGKGYSTILLEMELDAGDRPPSKAENDDLERRV
jgi:hypothetical protein